MAEEKGTNHHQITNVNVRPGGFFSGLTQGAGCCVGVIIILTILFILMAASISGCS